MLLFILLPSVAVAHPMGADLVGHRLDLHLSADAARVDYDIEVPTFSVVRELRALAGRKGPLDEVAQAAWIAGQLDELQDGLALKVDGAAQQWTRLPQTEPSGVGDERFVVFHLHLRADLPEGARTLSLRNGNRPDEPSLFQTSVGVADDLRLDDCSLLTVLPGKAPRDRSGQWRAEEENRELRLSFARRSLPLPWTVARLASCPSCDGELPAGQASVSLPVLSRDALRGGQPGPRASGWCLAVMAATGLLAGPAGAGRGRAILAPWLVALPSFALAWRLRSLPAPTPSWTWLIAAVLVIVAAVALWRTRVRNTGRPVSTGAVASLDGWRMSAHVPNMLIALLIGVGLGGPALAGWAALALAGGLAFSGLLLPVSWWNARRGAVAGAVLAALGMLTILSRT